MKMLFACFLFCAFSFNLINTKQVMFEELNKSIDILNKFMKVGMQRLHSPINIPESCLLSAFECFVNETLLLKPAHSEDEKIFNITVSRIRFSQRNVGLLLRNSDKNCYPCVNYPEKQEPEFLNEFRRLLQRLCHSMM